MAQFVEGFDIDTTRNIGCEKTGATKLFQYLGQRKTKGFGQLYAHNHKQEGTQFQKTENAHN